MLGRIGMTEEQQTTLDEINEDKQKFAKRVREFSERIEPFVCLCQ